MSKNNSNSNNKYAPAPPRRGFRGGGGPPHARFEKPKDFKTTFSKLVKYLAPYKIKLAVVGLFAAGSTVFSIIGPKILGKATTKIYTGLVDKVAGIEGAGVDFGYIGQIIMGLIALYVASAVFAYIQGFIVAGVAQDVSYNLRRDISLKVHRLPLKYFDGTSFGDVLSRVTNDVDTVSHTLSQSTSQIITSVTTFVGVLIMMLSISWQMTGIALVMLPITAVLVMFIVKRSQKYFRAQQESLGQVNGQVEEVFGGHIIMKAFNAEAAEIQEFDEINTSLYESAWKSQFISGLLWPIMNFIGNLGYVVVTIMGGWFAIRRTIQVGDILAFIQYMRSFTQPIAQIAQISNVLQSTVAAAERVFEFLGEKEEKEETGSLETLNGVRGQVDFKNVGFQYVPGTPVIEDFSAQVQAGQNVAIVGPTGAGKTTIVKLLMRFYDLDQGAIFIDGQDIATLAREEVRDQLGMVLQDTWLFSGTIMENIRYGRLDATDDEVIAAAKLAHAHRFITTLPDGYQMLISEEADNVSHGQKQLLTIARAILADPKILILDEATSSVDTRTEALLQKAMENLMKNRTSFIIAHRLSTIKNADLILVMDEGDIVEQGTHTQLLEGGGFYATLYNSQFEVGTEMEA